ncbi:MAG: tyrosine-type recombinase/integrase [Anaerovoracaceae bacterium]
MADMGTDRKNSDLAGWDRGFTEDLAGKSNVSDNTRAAYISDIRNFRKYAESRGHSDPEEVTNTDVIAYLSELRDEGRSKSTINRKLASIRAFYRYLVKNGFMEKSPADDIKSPKVNRKNMDYLTIEEVDRLLSMPDDTLKGKRDRAMLEVMYATGIRVSEIIEMKLSDADVDMGFVKCSGDHGMARIVPMGEPSVAALRSYLKESRPVLMKSSDPDDPEGPLFVNFHGKTITRQGCWKILKKYGDMAGIQVRITPQTLRNSFAIHMARNGIDIKTLQELMGHCDISATQAYFTETKNRIKDIYDRTHPRAKRAD